MFDLGPHAAFIWISYAAAALCVVGLVCWAFLDERTQRKRLAELERRGLRRRSASER
jgi:heme exporter protein D